MSDELSPRPAVSAARAVATILAVRSQCVALVKLSELLLQDLGYEKPEAVKLGTPPESCTHPANARVPAPVMGKPARFICRACMEEVNA